MILSNIEILKAIAQGAIKIGDLNGSENPGAEPFNTTTVDLHLGDEVRRLPPKGAAAFDLTKAGLTDLLERNTEAITLKPDGPFTLRPRKFVLANTRERIRLPLNAARKNGVVYGARVEGRSSVARCGVLIHFTAPTIHPGFGKPVTGSPITLEICNLGEWDFMLYPGMAICQLIVEVVKGRTAPTANQFARQDSPTGASR